MKEKRKERNPSSDNRHKKKKKHKRKYESSDDSDSSGDKIEWVEASPVHSKSKKKKKKKKNRHARSSTSGSESDKGKTQFVETNPKESGNDSNSADELVPKTVVEERDSWMNEETFVHTFSKDKVHSSSRQRRADAIKEQHEKEEKIQRERELNPHLKKKEFALTEKETNVESLSLPSTSVGDGGYSWLKRAYYRIQEQAQQEGRSMEEIAIERWGSLSKLTSMIEEAEQRMKSHPDWKRSRNQYRDRFEFDDKFNRRQFKKPNDMDEVEKTSDITFQFRKPIDDSKNRKVLNNFKSSRKESMKSSMDMKAEFKNFCLSDSSYKEDSEIKSYSNDKYNVPAWKKSKDSEISNKNEDARTEGKKNNSEDSEIRSTSHNEYAPAWKKSTCSKNEQMSDSSDSQMAMDTGSVPLICSANDLNDLAAKQLRAELMGETLLAEKLKKQLEEARQIVEEKGFAQQPCNRVKEVVVLSKFDNQGVARPIQTTQKKITDYKHKRSNKFFDDDSSYSLKQMFEREKMTTAEDQMEMFVEASSQSNELAEIDYESGHISKRLCKKLSSTRQEERDIGKAMQQHQKLTTSLEKCHYCLDQPNVKKHLMVDIGENVYLCLPNYQTMTKGHCLIVPKKHVSSFLSLDENEWREVNDFKNQLRNMFRPEKKSVIFLETSMCFRHFPHAVLECIPVPQEEGYMAPFYFKKAIQESESEWANNKKLIDLSNKGLRHSVPKGLPYFYAEFDPEVHAGYAHVIEDEKKFPRNFGKEIVGGMLDIDYNYLYKNKKDDFFKKNQEVFDFSKKWELLTNAK